MSPYTDYFTQNLSTFLESCKSCGQCVKVCPSVPLTDLKVNKPGSIQLAVRHFLETGEPNQAAYQRAFSCLECFKCAFDICPQGIDMLSINELVRQRYQEAAKIEPPALIEQTHANRILAAIQVDAKDHERIFTPSPLQKTHTIFFPGCNIYSQPDKLLTALDILDQIDPRIGFLPGLDYCCGNNYLWEGFIKEGDLHAQKLLEALSPYQPRQVVLWCATCHVRFEKYLSAVTQLPFEVLSLPQFIAANLDKLKFERQDVMKVTLHNACKEEFTGLDRNALRWIMRNLNGIELVEMERCGKDTVCCGGGASGDFAHVRTAIRDDRLAEAADTGADTLVDVCHYCHHVFAPEAGRFGLRLENYIKILGRYLGFTRPDRYRIYRGVGGLETALQDAESLIQSSLYTREDVEGVLRTVLQVG